jgi:tetratricopeptide (TPR) repeat protein
VVLISAEPGFGKSRLTETLVERVAAEPHVRLRYFCSPYHQDTALYPVIAQLERAAGFIHGDEPATRLAKLRALLDATIPSMEDVALIAALHGLTSVDLTASVGLSPQIKKDKTIQALLRQVESLSHVQPVLMTIDDLHWMDPSSHELLDGLIQRIPEFQAPWAGQPHVTALMLSRLDRRETATMVASVAGSVRLPTEVVGEIAERTDGVPLFVEELTKAVLESNAQSEATLSTVLHLGSSVPATLHASLVARLDRLGMAAKAVAQTGAAIGRDFEYGLLARTAGLPEPQLQEALEHLTNSGLLLARGMPPRSSYSFKHALVQDAAYGTLLRGRRQRLHGRIAASIEDRFPEIALKEPARLAQHCEAAGLPAKAVGYWLKAGRNALAGSAMAEAVAQLRKGLAVLSSLPDDSSRQQHELDLQTVLSLALTATKGYSAEDASETVNRARTLAEQLGRPEYLIPLLVGQRTIHVARSEHRFALAIGEQLEQIGEARNDAAARLLGRYSQGVSRLWLGDFTTARSFLEQCMGLADPAHRTVGERSHDPYVVLLTWLGLSFVCLGYIDRARSWMDQALSEARRLRHAYTLAHVLCMANWLDWLIGTPLAHLEEYLALTTEHKFPFYLGWAQAFRGLQLAGAGQAAEGLVLLTQSLAQLRAIGSVVSTPQLFIWLAETNAMLAQPAETQVWLAEAAQFVATTDERFGEAELLHRIPGDLLSAAGDRLAAERHYHQAIAIAERQNAKLFQMRASISLARLWNGDGRRDAARDLLTPVFQWFTEGHDSPDLTDAKILLDELS